MARGRESTAEVEGAEEAPETNADVEVDLTGSDGPVGPGTLKLDLDFVRGLIEAVDGSGIDSLEITRAGTRVKISKTPPAAGPLPTYVAAAPQPAVPPPQAAPGQTPSSALNPPLAPTEASSDVVEATTSPETDGLVEITSPMVGTFYRAPAPDAPPYVEVGSTISQGQTLCILEAMKLMNELEAELAGEIREILVENAEPVEYGQVLFRIAPNG